LHIDFINIIILLVKIFAVVKPYLCKFRTSFAISVPILPAPSSVPADIPGTLKQDCLEDPKQRQKKTPIEDFKKVYSSG
jgi:hypothetical protein